jgi:hypothetical protein
LPSFFSKIWGGTGTVVTATATAEAYNPANVQNFVPIAPKAVKPWLVANIDPNSGSPFITTSNGNIETGVTVIGETLNLTADCVAPGPTAVYVHDGTYSVITKNNFYSTSGPYYITQLNADLVPEWSYQSVDNFEWCVNASAVDKVGTVYADSEDGNLFVIKQGGTLKGQIFLQQALGAAYTPVSIGLDGKIYTLNNGDMFVVGN